MYTTNEIKIIPMSTESKHIWLLRFNFIIDVWHCVLNVWFQLIFMYLLLDHLAFFV